ncbi:hypothetical protein COLO4_12197 [Corchorus olitorius]|uniref:protein-synthesizing GTPase n=1 Tax=Corchorus olitorius TaxID=93759 RepID=A0A1R3K1T1_9ROSI|nr:hypothetical protein COLO4_12197 [Corchorus olitorius]
MEGQLKEQPDQREEMDVTNLHPLSPEIISRQATINIGTIGHVAHGKSTLVKAISGVKTVRFKKELERNITMELGYANAKIYRCLDKGCPRPLCFKSCGSEIKEDSPLCDNPERHKTRRMQLVRHVSFVDCPGHEVLMATMLNGAAIMDGAFLLVAANEECPQPQTIEHLVALEIMGLNNIIILQNKVDCVKQDKVREQYRTIRQFTEGTTAEGAPVIPISAQLNCNIDVVLDHIVNRIPIPVRDFKSKPSMTIVRSFDVNKPGAGIDELKGGVVGGSIIKGVLKANEIIEIRPGIVTKDGNGNLRWRPIMSRVVSLYAEQNKLEIAVPGGLIGVGTTMDPSLGRGNKLVGHVVGLPGSMPDVYTGLVVKFYLLERLVGIKGDQTVTRLVNGEMLMVNVGSMSAKSRVITVRGRLATLQLSIPVCTSIGERVALSRRIDNHWRLIGWGSSQSGTPLQPHQED